MAGDDDTLFSNLPTNPAQQQGAGAWAPAAWNRINALQKTQPAVADAIGSLTPDDAQNYFFDSDIHNNILTDVVNHHMMDQHFVERTTTPSQMAFEQQTPDYWRSQLEQLRTNASLAPPQGRPFNDEMASLNAIAARNAPPRAPSIQPASQPWNTFRLQPPKMPPFPANDPRGAGPPPGTTLNTPKPMFAPQLAGHTPVGLVSEAEMLQRIREGLIPPHD